MCDRDEQADGIRTGRGPGDPDGLVTVDDVVADDADVPAGVGDAVREPEGTTYGHAEEDTLEVADADPAAAPRHPLAEPIDADSIAERDEAAEEDAREDAPDPFGEGPDHQ